MRGMLHSLYTRVIGALDLKIAHEAKDLEENSGNEIAHSHDSTIITLCVKLQSHHHCFTKYFEWLEVVGTS
jgi:hypothetical protein